MAKLITAGSYIAGIVVYAAAIYLYFTVTEHTIWSAVIAYITICVGLSLAAFVAVGADKRIAKANRSRGDAAASRVPENVLHGLEIAGGWAGSYCAQQAFRHKTSKQVYQVQFWSAVALHGLLLIAGGVYLAGHATWAAGVAGVAVLQIVVIYLLAARWKKQTR